MEENSEIINAKVKKDFYTKISYKNLGQGIVIFNYPTLHKIPLYEEDWYMVVALEKADLVRSNRHQLTSTLLIDYRNAIRNAYDNDLDSAINKPCAYPLNRNTIEGMRSYVSMIDKRLNEMIEKLFFNTKKISK